MVTIKVSDKQAKEIAFAIEQALLNDQLEDLSGMHFVMNNIRYSGAEVTTMEARLDENFS